MSQPAIISFGEVLWDLFPEGERFGGAPANFACHAAILGGKVSMASAVGDDARGRESMRILQSFGVDVSLLQVIPDAPTGTVGVTLDAQGKPTFTIHQGSAWDRLCWQPELQSPIEKSDAVYFGTLGQRFDTSRATIRQAMNVARSAGIPRVLDINLRPPFFDATMIRESTELASVLKLSDDELPEVCAACDIKSSQPPQELLGRLQREQSLELVIMTRGAEGAMLASSQGIVEQPGIPTTVRDTVGAGDSFTAAFLLGWLRREAHEHVLRKACEVAAAVCAHLGAVPDVSANKLVADAGTGPADST